MGKRQCMWGGRVVLKDRRRKNARGELGGKAGSIRVANRLMTTERAQAAPHEHESDVECVGSTEGHSHSAWPKPSVSHVAGTAQSFHLEVPSKPTPLMTFGHSCGVSTKWKGHLVPGGVRWMRWLLVLQPSSSRQDKASSSDAMQRDTECAGSLFLLVTRWLHQSGSPGSPLW